MGNNSSFMLQDEEILSISDETGFTPAQVEKLYTRFISLDKGCNGSLSRQDCLAIPELAINPLCDRIVQMFFNDCDADHERINFRQFMKSLAPFRPISAHNNHYHNYQNHNNNDQNPNSPNNHHDSNNSINTSSHSSTNQHSFYYASNNNHHHHHHLHSSSHSNLLLAGINNNLTSHHHHHHNTQLHHSASSLKKSASHSVLAPEEPPNSRKQKLYFMFKLYDVDNDDKISLDDVKSILQTMVGTYISESKLTDLAVETINKVDRNGTGFIEFEEFCAEFQNRDIEEALKVKFPSK